MIKITVEEIEILVTARVEDNLKQNMPKIKQMVEKIRQQFEKVDMSGISKQTKRAVQEANTQIERLRNTGVDKTMQMQFAKAGQSVEKYENQLEKLRTKMKQISQMLNMKYENTWNDVVPNGLDRNNPQVANAIEPVVNDILSRDSSYQKLSAQEDLLNTKISETVSKLQEAKKNYEQIGNEINHTSLNQNRFSSIISHFKQEIKSVVQNIPSIATKMKNTLNKVHNALSKIKNKLRDTFSGNHIKIRIKTNTKICRRLTVNKKYIYAIKKVS